MNDRRLSATVVFSAVLWTLGCGFAIMDVFMRHAVVGLAMVLAVGGATLTVRRFFCGLAERERNAFELGRDAELHAELRGYDR